MPSVDYDLIYMKEGLVVLESYLLSNDLYRALQASPPAGSVSFPSLTPGGLLLAYHRLAGRLLNGKQQTEFSHIESSFVQQRNKWRIAWERKVGQDLRARINQWRNFLEDYRESTTGNADRFAYEVRLRVMIDLLVGEIPDARKETQTALLPLDAILHSYLIPGKFIWIMDLEPAFPFNPYWYLYGSLRGNEKAG